MTTPTVSHSPSPVWKESLRAIRHNFVPGVVLWIVASIVVAAYYGVPAVQGLFAVVARWKSDGGFFYSVVATALFAGLIPFLVLRLVPATRAQATRTSLAFLIVFWAYRGFEVDLFYRFQGWLFGTNVTFAVVAPKVLFDMFVYNPVWAVSVQLLSYHWMNHGFRFSAFRGFHWREYFTRRVPVALLSTWVVWIPVVTLTYSLPSDLQIPLFNLAACFWALVVATLTKKD